MIPPWLKSGFWGLFFLAICGFVPGQSPRAEEMSRYFRQMEQFRNRSAVNPTLDSLFRVLRGERDERQRKRTWLELKKDRIGYLELKLDPRRESGVGNGQGYAAVFPDSMLLTGGAGVANAGEIERVNDTTIFRAGSLGKPIVAMGILRLAAAGRLELSDKVTDLLPGIRFTGPSPKEMTVAHLLEHSSGLRDMEYSEYYLDSEAEKWQEVLFEGPLELRFPPGTCHIYSNIGYGLLGVIIENIAGKPFEEYLKESVLLPLGMTRSGFSGISGETRLAGPHRHQVAIPDDKTYALKPAVSFRTCAVDLGKFLVYLMYDPPVDSVEFLPAALRKRLFGVHTTLAAKQGLRTGYTSGMESTAFEGRLSYGLSAGVEGYSALIRIFPEEKCGYVVLSNDEKFPRNAERSLARFIAGKSPLSIPKINSGKEELPEEGIYYLANYRNHRFGFLQDMIGGKVLQHNPTGQILLYGRKGQEGWVLERDTTGLYRILGENVWNIAFGELPDGGDWMQVEDRFFIYEKGSEHYFHLSILLGCLIVMSIAGILGLVGLARKIFGADINGWALISLILPVALFLLVLFTGRSLTKYNAGVFSVKTLVIFLGTLLMPVFGLSSWGFAAIKVKGVRFRILWAIFAIANGYVVWFMFHYDLIALRLW